MKIGVVGSRTFSDYMRLKRVLDELKPTEIISGGAIGADTLASQYAREHNLPLKVHIPDWKMYGRRAGFLRNTHIVRDSEMVVAFWDGRSHGTADTIKKTEELGISLRVERF